MQAKKKKILTYKDKPLLRVGNTIFYGNLGDKYLLELEISDTTPLQDITAATKVVIKLVSNTEERQVFRKSERENLYTALDIGEWWLHEALSKG